MNIKTPEAMESDAKHAADELKEKAMEYKDKAASQIKDTAENVSRQSKEAYYKAKDEACDYLSCANDKIRQNPLPAVAGAFAFGIAVGCLIMSGRSSDNFQDRYVTEPLDEACGTLGRLYGNLKFW